MAATASFNDLAKLTDREIQTLMREVDQKDLVVALTKADKAVTDKTLSNMSERVRTFIQDEVAALGPMRPDEVAEVQKRIVQQTVQLAEQGQVSWPPGQKKAPKVKAKKAKKLSKKYLAMKSETKQTAQKSLDQLSFDEINTLFTNFAEIARKEGILALENMVSDESSAFISNAIRLAVDGTEPDLIMDILETWMGSLLHEQERKYQKVIEGLMSIQSGDNPRIVEHKLSVIY